MKMAYYNYLEESNKTLSYAKRNKRNIYFSFSFGPLTWNLSWQSLHISISNRTWFLTMHWVHTKYISLFFTFSHANYARWLHGQLSYLESTHPEINDKFLQGNFVVWKTLRSFSGISIDHCTQAKYAKRKRSRGKFFTVTKMEELKSQDIKSYRRV